MRLQTSQIVVKINFFALLDTGANVYLSPTDTSCINIDYPKEIDSNSDANQRARVRKFFIFRPGYDRLWWGINIYVTTDWSAFLLPSVWSGTPMPIIV